MADRRFLAVVGFITQAPVIRKILNRDPYTSVHLQA